MSRWYPRRGSASLPVRARHLLAAGLGAMLLVALLAAGAANAASTANDGGSNPRSASVVQREATVAISASNTARSHRLVITGGFLFISGLAAVTARCMAARRQLKRHRRGATLHARLRAPPSLFVVAH
jgi:hypothetical protein